MPSNKKSGYKVSTLLTFSLQPDGEPPTADWLTLHITKLNSLSYMCNTHDHKSSMTAILVLLKAVISLTLNNQHQCIF